MNSIQSPIWFEIYFLNEKKIGRTIFYFTLFLKIVSKEQQPNIIIKF